MLYPFIRTLTARFRHSNFLCYIFSNIGHPELTNQQAQMTIRDLFNFHHDLINEWLSCWCDFTKGEGLDHVCEGTK